MAIENVERLLNLDLSRLSSVHKAVSVAHVIASNCSDEPGAELVISATRMARVAKCTSVEANRCLRHLEKVGLIECVLPGTPAKPARYRWHGTFRD